jgi:hypothetical protein
MKYINHTSSLASKAIDDPEMHPDDRPEAFERMTPAEQAALLKWIRLAIKPAKTVAPNTSYGIKHDFESVGFYISNGQLKGAMLTAGFAPVDSDELNWEFRIRPTGKRSKRRNGAIYHVDHLTPEEREELEALVRVAQKVRTRRYEENHRDNTHPANLSA